MKNKVAALVLALIGGNVWAVEPLFPVTHPESAVSVVSRDWTGDSYPTYFWWEKGNLWMEVVPNEAGVSFCIVDVQQGDKYLNGDLRMSDNEQYRCTLFRVSTVFRVVQMETKKAFTQYEDSIIFYHTDDGVKQVSLPAASPEPSPSPAPEFNNPKVSLHDLNVLKVTCQRKNKKKPGVLLTEDGSYICDGLPIKPGDKVTITVVGTSK